MSEITTGAVVAKERLPDFPPALASSLTPEVRSRVEEFYCSVADIFESWVARSESHHTQRAYHADVMGFVRFLGWRWPENAELLLRVGIADVQRYRSYLVDVEDVANKTLNRRICSLSAFYKYLGGCAAELRLPVMVPNPASAQFVRRAPGDAREETKDLSLARARLLISLPSGEEATAYRDRAILRFYLYTGARIAAGCRLEVKDFFYDHDNPKVTLREKGRKVRTIGLHPAAAEAIREYLEKAAITSGPLFRPLAHSRSKQLAEGGIKPRTMWDLLRSYLSRLPGAMYEAKEEATGQVRRECHFTPHSLRATTATLLLDAGVDIMEVRDLLGHAHVTTTQGYDKRRRAAKESASHKVPL